MRGDGPITRTPLLEGAVGHAKLLSGIGHGPAAKQLPDRIVSDVPEAAKLHDAVGQDGGGNSRFEIVAPDGGERKARDVCVNIIVRKCLGIGGVTDFRRHYAWHYTRYTIGGSNVFQLVKMADDIGSAHIVKLTSSVLDIALFGIFSSDVLLTEHVDSALDGICDIQVTFLTGTSVACVAAAAFREIGLTIRPNSGNPWIVIAARA